MAGRYWAYATTGNLHIVSRTYKDTFNCAIKTEFRLVDDKTHEVYAVGTYDECNKEMLKVKAECGG